ncbi:MAG: NADH-quinone oxidoreductase subunit NuoG, partial [Nitrospirales bacterium]|nr:NADH-quinone oxidoreductase subunit NuoG [Nitrospirales bacterium]
MPTIYIENIPYEVKEGVNLLHACLSLGFNVPYFCWHPAMKSVGACRQCAVKQFRDEKDTKGKIVMSCMTPAADGTRISLDDPEVRAFRKSVIEWLMTNHPHDCPICDEGGECHLQDMTLMTGHTYRRFRFRKRTHRDQYLGPLINHEMNRCIQCYRCVRFYQDYAGGRDLVVLASHNHVYFGRHEEGVLESPFSGNLVEVCPTGVFTDKTLKRHYTRKWDLQTAPSVCVQCGLGCNTIPGERYGMLRRIRNRYNGEVNRYFLCDRGRYGYEFVNSDRRIRHPLLRDPAERVVSSREALDRLASLLYFGARVIGIGSPRASLEANFALRSLVGPERFYSGMGTGEHRLVSRAADFLKEGPARSPSLHDIELSDAMLVLGEDVQNTAPIMALALRQSVRQKPMESMHRLRIPEWDDNAVREAMQQERGPLYLAVPCSTALDPLAAQVYHAAPADIARFGFAVAHALGDTTPEMRDMP